MVDEDTTRIRERKTVLSILAFALRFKASALKWRKHNDDEAVHQAAEQVLAHMEGSNVRMKMGPPQAAHSTHSGPPAPRTWPVPRAFK